MAVNFLLLCVLYSVTISWKICLMNWHRYICCEKLQSHTTGTYFSCTLLVQWVVVWHLSNRLVYVTIGDSVCLDEIFCCFSGLPVSSGIYRSLSKFWSYGGSKIAPSHSHWQDTSLMQQLVATAQAVISGPLTFNFTKGVNLHIFVIHFSVVLLLFQL